MDNELFDFLEQINIYDSFDDALLEQGELLLGTDLEDLYKQYIRARNTILQVCKDNVTEDLDENIQEVLDNTE